jgi:hypothetical protein
MECCIGDHNGKGSDALVRRFLVALHSCIHFLIGREPPMRVSAPCYLQRRTRQILLEQIE